MRFKVIITSLEIMISGFKVVITSLNRQITSFNVVISCNIFFYLKDIGEVDEGL